MKTKLQQYSLLNAEHDFNISLIKPCIKKYTVIPNSKLRK